MFTMYIPPTGQASAGAAAARHPQLPHRPARPGTVHQARRARGQTDAVRARVGVGGRGEQRWHDRQAVHGQVLVASQAQSRNSAQYQ